MTVRIINLITGIETQREYTEEELLFINMPRPPSVKRLTSLQMLNLFTEAEQLLIVEATMVSPLVKLWYDRLLAADFVTIEDPRTLVGLETMVVNNLLSEERKAEIVENLL